MINPIEMESIVTNSTKFQVFVPTKEKLITAICCLCMALFFYTAYPKIVDHARFLKGLTRVHLISGFAVFISFAVPAIEIIVGFLLVIPQTAKTGLYSFIAVMSAFTAYIVSAMILEPRLPCLCGGGIEELSWGQHIWLNFTFIIFAIVATRLIKLNTSLNT